MDLPVDLDRAPPSRCLSAYERPFTISMRTGAASSTTVSCVMRYAITATPPPRPRLQRYGSHAVGLCLIVPDCA
jgi:hypothetical protein